jgi:isopenicillin N synthase-like dioxygenase
MNKELIKKSLITNSVTFRENIKLPSLPSDKEGLNNIPIIDMPRSELIENNLVFELPNGFKKALELGFFLVKIPKEFNLSSADNFVRNFFKPKNGSKDLDKYRGFKDVDLKQQYQGYFDRDFDQWENFYIESSNWESYLTPELDKLGNQMTELGISILKNVLRYLEIPKSIWELVTSGLSKKNGHHMLAFNHFRSSKPVRGTKFHRDSGWVTVLRSWQPGLVALINDKIYAINPVEGNFIINFGSSIEVLTQKLPNPARGNIHGVVRTIRNDSEEERFSYVMFLDSNLAGNIYQLDENKKPLMVQTVSDFAIQEVSRTYDDDGEL